MMLRTTSRMLGSVQRRFIHETRDLKISEKGGRNSFSGINATVFGGSSQVGLLISSMLADKGSRCIYPYRHLEQDINEEFRDLRVINDFVNRAIILLSDFTDTRELGMAMRDQNVVIDCIGSRYHYKKQEEHELANIYVPRAIAKAVAASKTVKR